LLSKSDTENGQNKSFAIFAMYIEQFHNVSNTAEHKLLFIVLYHKEYILQH